MRIAGVEIAEIVACLEDRLLNVGFLDVHVIDVKVRLDIGGTDPLAHFDGLRSGVEHIGFVSVHDLEPEDDVAFRRHLRHVLQDFNRALHAFRRCRLGVFPECRFEDTADMRGSDVTRHRDGSLKLRLPALLVLAVVAGDVFISLEPQRGGAADPRLFELAAGKIHVDRFRVESGDFDQVETHLGRVADRAGTFLVAPTFYPYEGVYAELIHAVFPPIECLSALSLGPRPACLASRLYVGRSSSAEPGWPKPTARSSRRPETGPRPQWPDADWRRAD